MGNMALIGNKLDALFARLDVDGIETGIRERVTATRIVAELVVTPGIGADGDRMFFLLRARLTPLLAKSPEEVDLIRRAFFDVFKRDIVKAGPQAAPPDRQAQGKPTPGYQWRQSYYLLAICALALMIGLTTGAYFLQRLLVTAPQVQLELPTLTPAPAVSDKDVPAAAPSASQELSGDELRTIAEQLVTATQGKRSVTLLEMARRISGPDASGVRIRSMLSLFERYLSRPPRQKFILTDVDLANLMAALAMRLYPGRTVSSDAIAAAVASSGLDTLSSKEGNETTPDLAPIPKSLLQSPWVVGSILAAPAIPFGWWLFRRRRRLKEYLRRRIPERPPLLHELVVSAPSDVMREQTLLTRAAIRLGRAREGYSRDIDVEATVNAIASMGGRPKVLFALRRVMPEYLVIIPSRGENDHQASQLDRLARELAMQNLSVVRYFMADNANLCFEMPESGFFDLDQLAARYPDHRLIFLGDGHHLLKPGTLATWPWAEDLRSWRRRAILTPRPIDEWGPQEAALGRLFDGPPLRAHSTGLLRLAELFERADETGIETVHEDRKPALWTWSLRPQRWLNPLTPDAAVCEQLQGELVRYFSNEHGVVDQASLWWLEACAIYPALRWDLTIYLGLRLTVPHTKSATGTPFYTEERALRLAALPWFREGFMPDWLRRQLLALLPKIVRSQATALLSDILERAVNPSEQVFDAVRLRIAQDWPDPAAFQPERDEIFIDALARHETLGLEAPRNLQDLKSGINNAFVAHEWTVMLVLAFYWLGAALLIPWQTGGSLGFGAFLPLLILPLGFGTWRLAERVMRIGTSSHAAR
jgi:hypothetical protein